MSSSSSSSSSSTVFSNISISDILLQISRDLEQHKTQHAEPPAKVPKAANIGNDFKQFVPKNADSLYGCLILDPDSAEDVARNWILSWRNNPEKETLSMLQLFVDVAGFQNHSVGQVYGKQTNDEILKDMLHDLPSSYDYGYLLQRKSNWAKQTIARLSSFLDAAVTTAVVKGVLFEDIFHEALEFLKAMCNSNVPAFKHTGIYFAILFCVPFGKITCNDVFVLKKLTAVTSYNQRYCTGLSSEVNRCKMEYNLCTNYTEFLAAHILNKCGVNDPDLEELHVFCANKLALLYFILETPKHRHKMVSVLIDYAVFFSTPARIAAIKCFETIFKDPRFTINNLNMTRIVAMLYDSTLDKSLEVAVRALKTLTVIMVHNPGCVLPDILCKLFLFMHGKHYAISKEAGHLFVAYLRHYTGDDLKKMYARIANYQSTRAYEGLAGVFVESILEAARSCLINPEVAVQLLLEDALEFHEEVALLDIIAHAVGHITLGKCLTPRDHSVIIKVDAFANEQIFDQILPKLPALFEKYINEEKCLKSLLLLLKNLPYADSAVAKYQSELTHVLKICTKIFTTINNEELLSVISETLYFSSTKLSPIQIQSAAAVKCIVDKCFDDYKVNILQSDWNEDVQSATNTVLLRMVAIRKFHNICEDENYTPLRDMLLCGEQTIVCDLKCEFSFLLQKLRLFAEKNERADIEFLKQSYSKFIDSSCHFLDISKSSSDKMAILECIFDIYIFQRANKDIPDVFTELTDDQILKVCTCIKVGLTNKSAASIRVLQKIIENVDSMPSFVTLYTWALYNKVYSFYGDQYDYYLKNFCDASALNLSVLLFAVISSEYKGLIGNGLRACESITELEKLSLAFATAIPRNLSCRLAKALIKCAGQDDPNVGILDQAKYFCSRLTDRDRRALLEELYTVFLGESRSHEKVQALSRYLKKPSEEVLAMA